MSSYTSSNCVIVGQDNGLPASLLDIKLSLIARFMGPIWGRQDPGGHHIGPMNLAIWDHPKLYWIYASLGKSQNHIQMEIISCFHWQTLYYFH